MSDKQTLDGRLEQIGLEIEVRLQKLDSFGEKAVNLVDSIDHLLAEAKKLCGTPEAFEAFKHKHCPDLGRSRTYELLAIKEGRKSLEDIRAATRARVAKHRVATKAVTDKPSVTSEPPDNVTDNNLSASVRLGNGQALDVNSLGDRAKEQVAALNEVEVSAGKRKAAYADDGERLTAEEPHNNNVTTSPPISESQNALTEFKKACDQWLPLMSEDERKKARVYHNTWKERPHRKAKAA